MMTFQGGKSPRSIGDGFEKEIARSFEGYARAGVAFIDFVPLPSRMVYNGKRPVLIPTGKPPFDFGGYVPIETPPISVSRPLPVKHAVMVGCEAKHTSKAESSLPIVKPDGDSHGLEWHQLDALANLARHGGIARVVWNNGGEVGVLTEGGILAAHAIYTASLATEQRGKGKGPAGSRSIKWAAFKPVPQKTIGGVPAVYDWLAN